MRIDLNTRTSESTESSLSKSGSQRAKSKGTGESSLGDATRVSLDGARLGKLEAMANAAPEIRGERVRALSGALRSGSYQFDSEQTASAMLSDKLARAALFR